MKKLILLWILVLTWMSCVSSKLTLSQALLLPKAPQTPALEAPEQLSVVDRERLAQFYRDYAKYLEKLAIYKQHFFS